MYLLRLLVHLRRPPDASVIIERGGHRRRAQLHTLRRAAYESPSWARSDRSAYAAAAEWESYQRKYWEAPERALLLEQARRHVTAVRRRAGKAPAATSAGEEEPAGSLLAAGEEAAPEGPDGEVRDKQVELTAGSL